MEASEEGTAGRERRSRKGCCLNVLAISGLVLTFGVVVGLNYAIFHFENEAFSFCRITPAMMDEWVKEPLKPTEAQLSAEFRVMNEPLRKEIAEFNDLGWRLTEKPLRAGYIDVDTSAGVVPKRFREWAFKQTLTNEEQSSVSIYVSELKKLLPMAKKLADNPEYFNNPTWDYDLKSQYSFTGMNLNTRGRLFDLAEYLSWDGDTSASLQLMEEIWKLDQPMAPFDVPYVTLQAYVQALGFIACQSSRARDLHHLQGLASRVEREFAKQPDLRFLGEYYVLLANQMLKDGYIKRMPETRLDWAEVKFDKYFYLKKQEKAGGGGPFIQSLQNLRDNEIGANRSHLIILQFFRWAFPYRTGRLAALSLYDQTQRHNKFRQEAYASYCLLKVVLAQRLAELQGKAISSPDDLVPAYLPAIPDDPYNLPGTPAASDTTGIKTLRFDPARGQFYSVGEDGTDGTGDEVFLLG